MVWGCFSSLYVGELKFIDGTLNSDKYIGILEEYVQPIFGDIEANLTVFQQDNAPCHKSKKY